MKNRKLYVKGKIYPELYIHLKLKNKISDKEKSRVLRELAQTLDRHFWKSIEKKSWSSALEATHVKSKNARNILCDNSSDYDESKDICHEQFDDKSLKKQKSKKLNKCHYWQINNDYSLTVELEDGSLKLRVYLAGSIFVSLLNVLGDYGEVRGGAEMLFNDVKAVYEYVTPFIYDVIGENNIDKVIHKERRKGIVTKLEELIVDYEEGRVDREFYQQKSVVLLSKINLAIERKELKPAVSHYLTSRLGENPELRNLLMQHPLLPEEHPHPPGDLPNNQQPAIFDPELFVIREDEDV